MGRIRLRIKIPEKCYYQTVALFGILEYVSIYLGKYNAGSNVIIIPGKSGIDFDIDGVS